MTSGDRVFVDCTLSNLSFFLVFIYPIIHVVDILLSNTNIVKYAIKFLNKHRALETKFKKSPALEDKTKKSFICTTFETDYYQIGFT